MAPGSEINLVNYLAQVDGTPPRLAFINPSEGLNEPEMLRQILASGPIKTFVDGLLVEKGGGKMDLTARYFDGDPERPVETLELSFQPEGFFDRLRELVTTTAKHANIDVTGMGANIEVFGTEDAEAFLLFLVGYDAAQYIERANGAVVNEFSPEPAMNALQAALEKDADWEAPYAALVNLCRLCTRFRVGTASLVEANLKTAIEKFPEDDRAIFALGELYEAMNDMNRALIEFERAAKVNPNEPGILGRIGMAQMRMQMPANAEKSFRRALELRPDDLPAAEMLSQVLVDTGRAHEVPAVWKTILDLNPDQPLAHAKYAGALITAGKTDEGESVFNEAVENLDNKTPVKRFYAPYLLQKGDHDRAMDMYEDVLEETPDDAQVMFEYAQALQGAGREFEIPRVLNQILALDLDANTRAQMKAWLIELEQPKRVAAVQSAEQKLQNGDAQGAVNELMPLQNWLQDYWKLWILLAAALNRVGRFQEAENGARHVIEMFPGCEPAYAELGQALSSQNRHEEAYMVMRMGAENVPNSLPIVMNLALAAKRAGRPDEARGIARQIRQAVQGNPEVDRVLDEIEA